MKKPLPDVPIPVATVSSHVWEQGKRQRPNPVARQLMRVHPEMSPAMAGFGQDQGVRKNNRPDSIRCAVTIVNLTGQAGIWLISLGLFFSRNADIW
ncbi:MAG: hypothetical protein DRH37_06235, partial [Deltaproteobacteria bacterium]